VPRDEDLILGELAVRRRLCTVEQIAECFRVQAYSRELVDLGDLLVYKGYLTEAQRTDLRPRAAKRILSCPGCGHIFSVFPDSVATPARCPKCRGSFDPAPATRRSGPEAEPAPRRAPALPPPPEAPSAPHSRIVCDAASPGSAEPGGRIPHPAGHPSFPPGRPS